MTENAFHLGSRDPENCCPRSGRYYAGGLLSMLSQPRCSNSKPSTVTSVDAGIPGRIVQWDLITGL